MEKSKIKWTINSRYAIVSCFDKDGILWVEKMISPHSVSVHSAQWINEVSYFFREKLASKSVPLVNPYMFDVRYHYSIQTSAYVGPDVEKFFSFNKLNKLNKISVVEKIISAMGGILLHNTDLEVGIDPRLSNFCINELGKVYYVDTFPPLVKYNEEYIVHFPNPKSSEIIKKEINRKFEPHGILRRFRFSILEQNSSLTEKDIILAIKNVLGKNFSIEVEDYFYHLPSNSPDAIFSLEDVDTIREIAISKAVFKNGKEREIFLTEIFELSSSFGALKLSKEEKLNKIIKLFE